jgi:hypothetical protein
VHKKAEMKRGATLKVISLQLYFTIVRLKTKSKSLLVLPIDTSAPPKVTFVKNDTGKVEAMKIGEYEHLERVK